MRDLDIELIEREFKKRDIKYAIELTLTYDYICELFKDWHIVEYSDSFFDQDCPNHYCDRHTCEGCPEWEIYQGSWEQLSFNNWFDVYGRGYWGATQDQADHNAKERLMEIMEADDLEYRLWTFIRNDNLWIFYYNRDRFADNWFIFEPKQ